jgi:hypothetical protein
MSHNSHFVRQKFKAEDPDYIINCIKTEEEQTNELIFKYVRDEIDI